jgi:hypothetical protein
MPVPASGHVARGYFTGAGIVSRPVYVKVALSTKLLRATPAVECDMLLSSLTFLQLSLWRFGALLIQLGPRNGTHFRPFIPFLNQKELQLRSLAPGWSILEFQRCYRDGNCLVQPGDGLQASALLSSQGFSAPWDSRITLL